jgi:pimeloyl-ACP methyl ester carboxylesterase
MDTVKIYRSEAGREEIQAAYEAVLTHWPVTHEFLRIPTCLGESFAVACGDPSAPALILLHGSSANAAMWIGDVAQYSRHFRVYALDMPGEPGKSAAARPALSSGAYADWLLDVFNSLHIEQAFLAGISLGGWLAIQFTAAHPERVKRLALLCPSGVGRQNGSFLFKAICLMPFGRWGQERLVRMVNGNVPLAAETVTYMLLISSQFMPRMETVPLFSDEELLRLNMPVLLYVGARDVLLRSQETLARLTRLLPRLTAHLLPEAGHVLIGLSAPILEFLTA